MELTIAKITKPNMVDKNMRIYSQEVYDEMKKDIKDRHICLTNVSSYEQYSLATDYTTVKPETIIGKVKEIYDDYIVVDIDENKHMDYIKLIKSGKYVAGMRMLANISEVKNGISIISKINLICFDLLPASNIKFYYQLNTNNKSFKKLFDNLLFKENDIEDILLLKNKDLAGDFYIGTGDYYTELAKECKDNIWFFFRNIFKIKDYNDKIIDYKINTGTYKMIKAYDDKISLISYIPRCHLSTITLVGLYIYTKLFTNSFPLYITRRSFNAEKSFKEKIDACMKLIPDELIEAAKNLEFDESDKKQILLYDEFEFNDSMRFSRLKVEENQIIIGSGTINNELSKSKLLFVDLMNDIKETGNYKRDYLNKYICDRKDIMSEEEYKVSCKSLNNKNNSIKSELDLIREQSSLGTIVCLCGSTKYKKDFNDLVKKLSLKGYIVLSTYIYSQAESITLTTEQLKILTETHYKKIKMADLVIAITKEDGSLGQATSEEIDYAKFLNKDIIYYQCTKN